MIKYNIKLQHDKKKYHAIERIRLLLDKGSFQEIGGGITNEIEPTPYDAVITGHGLIHGKNVYVFAQDFTQQGGSIGLLHGRKIAHTIELAIRSRCPVIGIYDSGGARISEGIHALAGCGEMMRFNTLASGYIPQISVIVGPCAGAAAYSPAISDFIFCVNKVSQMYITGPNVLESITGEKCTAEVLGGTKVHTSCSGVAHFECENEKSCFVEVRKLVDILPSSYMKHNSDYPRILEEKNPTEHSEILPIEKSSIYDMKEIVLELVDTESFIEVHKNYGSSLLVGFAKMNKITIGVVANQPFHNGGVLDCNTSDKGARFIRFCDAFNIPIITLVDTPGYLPGVEQEHNGIIRHGAKLLFAYAESTSIKLTIIVRKAYGGAYIAMGSKHLGADYVYAFPEAEVAVMGAEGAVGILNRKELGVAAEERKKLFNNKVREYKEKFINVNIAVSAGYVDEIIEINNLRKRLIKDMILLQHKKEILYVEKKHGNIPL